MIPSKWPKLDNIYVVCVKNYWDFFQKDLLLDGFVKTIQH